MLVDLAEVFHTVSLGQAGGQRVDPMLGMSLYQLGLLAPFELLAAHFVLGVVMRQLVVSISFVPKTWYEAAFFVQIMLVLGVASEARDRVLGRAVVHAKASLIGVFPRPVKCLYLALAGLL